MGSNSPLWHLWCTGDAAAIFSRYHPLVPLKLYAPCSKHRLWHDLERECFYCMVERSEEQKS